MTGFKNHEIAEFINALRDLAVKYHDHDSLRERIAHVVWDEIRKRGLAIDSGVKKYK